MIHEGEPDPLLLLGSHPVLHSLPALLLLPLRLPLFFRFYRLRTGEVNEGSAILVPTGLLLIYFAFGVLGR
jgi:hypothetical protein